MTETIGKCRPSTNCVTQIVMRVFGALFVIASVYLLVISIYAYRDYTASTAIEASKEEDKRNKEHAKFTLEQDLLIANFSFKHPNSNTSAKDLVKSAEDLVKRNLAYTDASYAVETANADVALISATSASFAARASRYLYIAIACCVVGLGFFFASAVLTNLMRIRNGR